MTHPSSPRPALPAAIPKSHLKQALELLNIPASKLVSLDSDPHSIRVTYINTDVHGKVLTGPFGDLKYTTYVIPVA